MDTLTERMIWPRGHVRVLVALSGGADSVALLSLLRELPDGPELIAAHFEHGIRGEASRADAAFVRRLCADWGVELVEESADVPALARRRGVGLEQAAREARYDFLRRAAAQRGCDGICLAHHLDDQAETVLMHLARGCGLHGLRGMQEEQDGLIRPLLRLRKRELTAYLTERGIPWREDGSNRAPDNPRNALRLQVMPALERIYPGAAQAIGRLSRIARDEDDCLQALAEEYLRTHVQALPTGWQIAPGAHPAVLRRVIRRLLPLEALEVERILALPGGGGRLCLSGGRSAETAGGRLYLLTGTPPPRVCAPVSQFADLGPLGCVRARPWTEGAVRDNPHRQVLSARAVRGAVFRTRRPGDYLVPLGMQGRQKLSDYFINRHVDRPLRDLTVLLARDSEVLWVVGQGISERAKWSEGEDALLFEYGYERE